MRRELLIAAGPGEWRAALIEDGRVVALFVERGDRAEAGSLHLGRVRRLVPGLGAALVDIGGEEGDERLAFLPFAEMLPAGRRLDEGARAIVQVRREAQGGKAARLTMRALLPGEALELRVGRPGIDGETRLPPEQRPALRAALAAGGEAALGFRILDPAPADHLAADAARLIERWRDVCARAAGSEPPIRLYPSRSFAVALAAALPSPPERIRVDDRTAVSPLRAAFPASEIAEPEPGGSVDLDAAFDRALTPRVPLAGGGALTIEPTRAGVMIDVDSGPPAERAPQRTALAVDLAAAAAIADEIRRRNLGGGITVDFIGLDGRAAAARAAREAVRAALAEALAADPAGPQILGWTRLGHLELVRPRRGRPLAEALCEPLPGGGFVKTALTVAYEALRALRRADRAEPGRRWRLRVAPEVAAAFAAAAQPALAELAARFGRPVAIEAEPGRPRERFDLVAQ